MIGRPDGSVVARRLLHLRASGCTAEAGTVSSGVQKNSLSTVVLAIGSVLCAVAVAAAAPPCIECHDAEPAPATFAESAHGVLDCANCHTGAEELPHAPSVKDVDCATCHDDAVQAYQGSVHGLSRRNGGTEAPSCAACHGPIHSIRRSSDERSPVHPRNLASTCGTCHSNPEIVHKYGIPVAKPIEAYDESVHARASRDGEGGATCSSCHGTHDIRRASDPQSTVFHTRVPETCGQCHADIEATYAKSVHGRAVAHGAREAPVCTDCHGEHRILSPESAGSPVSATNAPRMTCGRCHGDLRLAEKYDLAVSAVPTYEDSYHGLAARGGKITVASCSSCHGVHDILPSSDPASHVYEDNLPKTCGACHPGAGAKYAIGTVHVLPTERAHAAVYWVRRAYLWIIGVTIGAMLLHNLLDLYRKARRRHAVTPYPVGPPRQRMRLGFRLAHAAMGASFGILVWTGFALTYPESFWAAPLVRFEEQLGLRGWLHRAAAIVLLGSLVFHFVHLALDKRARACIARMRPTWHDVTELRERLRWYFGRRADPPPSPTLGYPEKAEYLALLWGIAVMAITGFALWFENAMLRYFPKWLGDVATVIHFYEAVLATLAIVVWHFYFVLFDPVIYPMDTGWLTGREAPGRSAERLPGSET
jgi:cytochrome b subunit of formate dehydrogenase